MEFLDSVFVLLKIRPVTYTTKQKTKNTVVCSKLFKGIWEFWFILIMYGHPISCQNISWKKISATSIIQLKTH